MDLIEGINELVETIGEFPMSTGGSDPSITGTGIYSQARQFIRRETKRVLSQGWPENTSESKRLTLGGDGTLTTSAPTQAFPGLYVRGSGPDAHRNLVIRYDGTDNAIYDMDQSTFDLRDGGGGSSRTDVFVDLVTALDTETNDWGFTSCTPQLQDVIVSQAKVKFQRRLQGNLDMDTALLQEFQMDDAKSDRNNPLVENSLNVAPLLRAAPRNPQQGQGQ